MIRLSKLLVASVVVLFGVSVVRADDRPNVIFIMADDLGNADLSYRGSDIRTPNIDKLARNEATRFWV